MKEFLREIILEAGRISLDYRKRIGGLSVTHKSPRDIVTEADFAVEKFIVDRIRRQYPSHAILGEESGAHKGGEYRWIIDPIDGTISFFRDQPYYSVSIGIEHDGEFIFGAIYAPVLDELFIAEKGGGVFLNDKPVKVSSQTDLSQCLLATGFASQRDEAYDNAPYFTELLPKITDIRRCGSAALDMCYTACGRVDGFWELNLNIYDLAAGIAIAKEAGAVVSDFSGSPVSDYKEIVCANPVIQKKLVGELSAIKKKYLETGIT